jgi:hypothetical protein
MPATLYPMEKTERSDTMPRIVDSRSALAVRNLKESTQFYMNVLGFRRDFGDGSDGWSFLSRDNCKLRLGECPNEKPASELGDHSYFLYLTVEGLDDPWMRYCRFTSCSVST